MRTHIVTYENVHDTLPTHASERSIKLQEEANYTTIRHNDERTKQRESG